MARAIEKSLSICNIPLDKQKKEPTIGHQVGWSGRWW